MPAYPYSRTVHTLTLSQNVYQAAVSNVFYYLLCTVALIPMTPGNALPSSTTVMHDNIMHAMNMCLIYNSLCMHDPSSGKITGIILKSEFSVTMNIFFRPTH